VEVQRDRPNRKVHHVTEAGEAALTQWLQTHQPLPILREPLLVQLHFAAQMADAAIIQLLEQEVEARRKKLAACAAINALPLEVLPLEYAAASREQTMHRLVLELVTRREQLYLDWLKDAISIIYSQSTDY
jgi:PadR family transcriptional regulator, regulatory protein AphA